MSLHAVIGLSPLLSQTGEVKSADNKRLEQYNLGVFHQAFLSPL